MLLWFFFRWRGLAYNGLAHGEVPAYNNAEILFSQARLWELDGTVFQPTPSPSGHLGGGLL